MSVGTLFFSSQEFADSTASNNLKHSRNFNTIYSTAAKRCELSSGRLHPTPRGTRTPTPLARWLFYFKHSVDLELRGGWSVVGDRWTGIWRIWEQGPENCAWGCGSRFTHMAVAKHCSSRGARNILAPVSGSRLRGPKVVFSREESKIWGP